MTNVIKYENITSCGLWISSQHLRINIIKRRMFRFNNGGGPWFLATEAMTGNAAWRKWENDRVWPPHSRAETGPRTALHVFPIYTLFEFSCCFNRLGPIGRLARCRETQAMSSLSSCCCSWGCGFWRGLLDEFLLCILILIWWGVSVQCNTQNSHSWMVDNNITIALQKK